VKRVKLLAAVLVAVFCVSACSYSDDLEAGVRNAAIKTTPAYLSDDCEKSHADISWACLSESEQHRAAGLLNAVRYLVVMDETVSYVGPWREVGTRLLKLLIDFEALEVLCYVAVFGSMVEEGEWPVDEVAEFDSSFDPLLLDRLLFLRNMVSYSTSKVALFGVTDTPVLESVRYRHLCPRWMQPLHIFD
jgi:hypothetical protein